MDTDGSTYMNVKKTLNNLIKTFLVLVCCTFISAFFIHLGIRSENIIMIYLCGVLFIEIISRSFFWGICSSFLSIIVFNYFFTQPTHSLEIYDPNYIITIIIFLIVSIITGSLANKMQQHAEISRNNERQTKILYDVSTAYLNLYGIERILHHHIFSLYEAQKIPSVVYYYNTLDKALCSYHIETIFSQECDDEMAKWCFDHKCECGFGTLHFSDDPWMYKPLLKHDEILGVCAIYHQDPMDEEKNLFINTLISQLVMALEREFLYEERENNRIEIEKEKLRNNLLRSISHDLRTPLTGIAGSSSLIIENYYELSDETKVNLIKNMSSDALWLTQLVENLLNMTRIQDGRLIIKKQREVVDDIICEAAQRCETRKGDHEIKVHLPEHVMLVEMDARLIIQVLVNMIDNAIKHTHNTSHIDICFHQQQHLAHFEVIDDGDGIDEDIHQTLFDSFVTTKLDRADAKRGVGLGLSICKAIVEAHGGTIYAHNQTGQKGAVFGFALPNKEEAYE